MKKRLIAVVAAAFAALLFWSGAVAIPQANGSGHEWERHHHAATHKSMAGNEWEFSARFGHEWE